MALRPRFSDKTPRNALPFLFAGQAQREFFVDESLARLDLLIHPAAVGEISNLPAGPEEGQCFLIAGTAGGIWAGLEEQITGWIAGEWIYAKPSAGMQMHDSVDCRNDHLQWRMAKKRADCRAKRRKYN